jgi:hypothetical protein
MNPHQTFITDNWGTTGAAVNLSSGNLVVAATDLSRPHPYLPLTVQRTYNSQACPSCSIIGSGWRLDAEWKIEANSDASVVTVTEGDGTEYRFVLNGSTYTAEAGYYGKLVNTQ